MKHTIKIIIHYHAIKIFTFHIDQVLAVLNDPGLPYKIAWPTHREMKPDEKYILSYTGFFPSVIERLEANGYPFKIKDISNWPQYAGVPGDAREACLQDPVASVFADAILTNPRGQLVVDSTADRLYLVAQALTLFPKYRFIIATKNLATSRRIVEGLQPLTKRQVVTELRKIWGLPTGVLVWPANTLGCATTQDFGVFVYWDVEAARALRTLRKPWHYDRALAYTFIRSNSRLDAEDQYRIEKVFGQVIYRRFVDDPDDHWTTVTVLTAGPSTYPPSTNEQTAGHRRRRAYCSGLERKRSNLWQNERRNQQIATIALACRNRDLQALQQAGILIEEPETFFERWNSEPRVAVVVEVAEHARALGKHLPGWPKLMAGRQPSKEYFDDMAATNKLVFSPEYAIVCYGYAEQFGIASDVVILAGGIGRQWPEHYGPYCDINSDAMVVIVYEDDFDQRAKQDAEARRQDYEHRCYEVQGYLC